MPKSRLSCVHQAMLLCVAVSSAGCSNGGQAGDVAAVSRERPKWQTINVGDVGSVSVRLKVLSIATPADTRWIGLEFENRGHRRAAVERASYRIESRRYDPRAAGRVRSGSLASGTTYDLFRKTSRVFVRPGTYRNYEHPSRYGLALLGQPPEDGLLVKATVHVDFQLVGDKKLALPREGVPFSFRWLPPDDAGLAKMRKRLKALLGKPEARSCDNHAYVLGALLRYESLSEDLTTGELLEAINRREASFDGRWTLVKHLAARDRDRPEVVQFYLQCLRERDGRACHDLLLAPSIWDRSFIEPLVVIHETRRSTALSVLSKHRDDWVGDTKVPKRLSSALLDRFGVYLKKQPDELEPWQLKFWAGFASDLSHTGDTSVIPLLRPFLDRKDQVYKPVPHASVRFEKPPAFRACGVALESILRIMDGDVDGAYRKAGYDPNLHVRLTWEERVSRISQLRDEMIAALKQRLENGNRPEQPAEPKATE